MDKRLKHPPAFYKQKLTEYAAFTIDIDTPIGTFRQKANKQENIKVVDEGTGRFRIYIKYQPLFRLIAGPTVMNPNMSSNALSIVTVTDMDITMKILENKFLKHFRMVFFSLCLLISSIIVFDQNLLFSILVLSAVPPLFLIERANKRHLQTLLIDFLNNL